VSVQSSVAQKSGRNQRFKLLKHIKPRYIAKAKPTWSKERKGDSYQACEEDFAISYMNRDVRAWGLPIYSDNCR
jgi:hypothetical protein